MSQNFVDLKGQALAVIDQHISLDKLHKEFEENVEFEENTIKRELADLNLKEHIKLYAKLTGIDDNHSFENIFLKELHRITLDSFCIFLDESKLRYILLLIEFAHDHVDIPSRIYENIKNFQHCIPVNILNELNKNHLMDLNIFLKLNVNRSEILKEFVHGLQSYCVKEEECAQKIAAELLCDLINSAYKQSSTVDKAMRKMCQYILHYVFKFVLTKLTDLNPKISLQNICVFRLIRTCGLCEMETLKQCFSQQVLAQIAHNPVLTVSDAISQQNNWKSCSVSELLLQTHKQILICIGLDGAMSSIHKALSKREVNWKYLLTFVSSVLISFNESAAALSVVIIEEIKKGLDKLSTDDIVIGTLLARQCTCEGAHVFMSYSAWFQKYFGSGSNCLTSSARSFRFFIKFLTNLVPCEPAIYLKIHVTKAPHAPNQAMRELLREYSALARTRLIDLKQTSGIMEADDSEITNEVEKVVNLYGKTGRIPASILEMSIFRKSHYLEKFLPVLLKARPLPDVEDMKMKLIAALVKLDKIPRAVHQTYMNACSDESRKLYQDIIDIDEDFDNFDKQLQQLKFIIIEYFDGRILQGNEQDGIKHGQPMHRCLNDILSNPAEGQITEEIIDLRINKSFDASVAQIVDVMLDVLSGIHEKITSHVKLMHFMKIIENYNTLKEAICHRVWKDCTDISESIDAFAGGMSALLIGTCFSDIWCVAYNPSILCNSYATRIPMKRESSLFHAVVSSLPFYANYSSFLKCTELQVILAKQISLFDDFVVDKQIKSTLLVLLDNLEFAKCRIQCSIKMRHDDFTMTKRRKYANEAMLNNCDINHLMKSVITSCDHMMVINSHDSQSSKIVEFIKREIWINNKEDFLSSIERNQLYKKHFFSGDISLIHLEDILHIILNNWRNIMENHSYNKQVIEFFCSNISLSLMTCECNNPSLWLLNRIQSRLADVNDAANEDLCKETSKRNEISILFNLMMHLPATFLFEQPTTSSKWHQDILIEEIGKSLEIFINEYLHGNMFQCDLLELIPHLFNGLVQCTSDEYSSLVDYLMNKIPLFFANVIIQWNDMHDVQCACKIRNPNLHKLLTDLHETLSSGSISNIHMTFDNLHCEVMSCKPVCLALLVMQRKSTSGHTVEILNHLMEKFPKIDISIIQCLMADAGRHLENQSDFDLSWSCDILQSITSQLSPSRIQFILSDQDPKMQLMFSTSTCCQYFYIAALRMLSTINLSPNIFDDEHFLPTLVNLQRNCGDLLESKESEIQLLFIKSARHCCTSVLKNESQKPDLCTATKTILKTELYRRFRS